MTETTHNPPAELHRVSCLRENLTSSSYGEELETGPTHGPAPRQFLTRQRTFAWVSRNRRLARDFERYAATVVAFIRIAMIRIMLRRLAANTSS